MLGCGFDFFHAHHLFSAERHEDIATTSNAYGDLGMDAKRRIQQRLVEFVKQQAEAQISAEEAARREAAWKQDSATVQ